MSRSEVWRKWVGELAASFALLTRLPVGRFVPPDENTRRSQKRKWLAALGRPVPSGGSGG